ncbi:hypothetical protein D3C76_1302230 [compost metagenome]
MVEVGTIDVSNFQLAPFGRLDVFCNFNNLVVKKVQSSHRIAGFRIERFFFNTEGTARSIKLNHTEALRIGNVISENCSSVGLSTSRTKLVRKMLTIKNVIAQDQAAGILADKFLTDDERLCKTIRARLLGVCELDAIQAAITQQLAEKRQVFRSGNDQNFPYAGQHQH